MRVNGALLSQHSGRPVVILGTVQQVDPSGMMVSLKASDDQVIQVKLQQPLQENLEGVMEVHGMSQGRQVLCQSYVTFPQESYANFDMGSYDEAVKLIHSVSGNPWKSD
ncbi:hypothetical protein Pcinc_016857 [Petrolisthes cinctipes]|uniref:Replication protein A3 n=1 Tax=Petrolisthes cinctipes TaxID=88211 RepID=A0AAE1F7P9_PETCI|nr:hypothetical protein Pcinc_026289 [Petrolisthes cinctipes]KAK3878513.1 hypothetical protein Pcinc_016857 [Petrolisthes cinctipes]